MSRSVTHKTTPRFWALYAQLPADAQELAAGSYETLKRDPRHPALHFNKVGPYWSVRIGLHLRSLAVRDGDVFVWFWIGTHADYDKFI
jgi:hypothetical protein